MDPGYQTGAEQFKPGQKLKTRNDKIKYKKNHTNQMQENKNDFLGYLTIQGKVLTDNNLTDGEKLLFGLVDSLSTKTGYCWASNAYLGSVLNKSNRTIQRGLETLEQIGLVARKVIYDKNGEVEARYVTVNRGNPTTKLTPGHDTDDTIITNINIATTKEGNQNEEQHTRNKLIELEDHIIKNADLYYHQAPKLPKGEMSKCFKKYKAQVQTEGHENKTQIDWLRHWRNWLLTHVKINY